MSEVATIDTIRSLGYVDISGTYAVVGSPTSFPTRIICFTNNTDGDMFFSNDGINNKFFVAASSFKLIDVCSNRTDQTGIYLLPAQTQWYVKQSTMPTKNAVYIECLDG